MGVEKEASMLQPHRIRRKRQDAGLSQRRLAELVGTDQAHISRIERGERMEMSIQTLEKLADVFGVTTDYLLGREGVKDEAGALVHA
jgi:transcriptional regulator with XRE-family HTH domain